MHPTITAITGLIAQFKAAEIHAARSGRAVMLALSQVVNESQAETTIEIADEVENAMDELLEVMPAYAPPLNVMHQVMTCVDDAIGAGVSIEELRRAVFQVAEEYKLWSEEARKKIAHYGSEIIRDDETVFTFTLSETILLTLQTANRQGKRFKVIVTESRPNNDGLVTTEKLSQIGVPVEIGIDACIGQLIPQADIMMVGAEGISADGSAVCKVGTYPSALVAYAHGIPVYMVVDSMKLNVSSLQGLTLGMDEINKIDVLSPDIYARAEVIGHLFDETPAELLRGIVTERGILNPSAIVSMMREMRLSETISDKLSTPVY